MKWFSEVISALALLVSMMSAIYAHYQTVAAEEQVQVAKQSYDASIKQLVLAQKAQQTSEANYKLSLDQLELQKDIVASDNRYQVVIGADSDKNLQGSLSNAQSINFSFLNGSKNAVTYRVTIRSEGVGLFWSGMQADKMYYRMQLDHRPIFMQPSEIYRRSFGVWIGKTPAPKAKISIYVNDELVAEYNYKYNVSTSTYIYQHSSDQI